MNVINFKFLIKLDYTRTQQLYYTSLFIKII